MNKEIEQKSSNHFSYFKILILVLFSNALTITVIYFISDQEIRQYKNIIMEQVSETQQLQNKMVVLTEQVSISQNKMIALTELVSLSKKESDVTGKELSKLLSDTFTVFATYHNAVAPSLELISRLDIYKDGPLSIVGVKDSSISVKRIE